LRDIGKCLIFSTHIMREVERLCDSIGIMHQGRLLDIGSLEDLRERHSERDFEELFFGLLSRNDAEAEREISERWLATPDPTGPTGEEETEHSLASQS
jgi:ABC-type multidrug transport system ATPase subunit